MSNRRKHRTIKVRQHLRVGGEIRTATLPVTHPEVGAPNATVAAIRNPSGAKAV